jgi:VanZ family protein
LLGATVVLALNDAVPALYRRLAAHLPDGVRRAPLFSFSSPWGWHFLAFAAITLLAVLATRGWRGRIVVAAALLGCGWGIELMQRMYTSRRSYEVVDLAADARGVAVGFTAAVCLLTLRPRIRPIPAGTGQRAVENGTEGASAHPSATPPVRMLPADRCETRACHPGRSSVSGQEDR